MSGATSSAVLLSFIVLATACGSGDLTLPGPGEPAAMTIVAGDGQRGAPGQLLTEPLVVEVLDGDGRPVSGTSVAFRFADELPDAAVVPGTTPTDGQGRASARAQLGRQAGSQAIDAEVVAPGRDLRVRFRLTAMANDPGGGGGGAGGDGGGGGGNGGGGGAGGGNGGGPGPDPAPAPDPPPGGGGGGGADGGGGHGHGHGKGHGKGHSGGHGGGD
jgi:hypothetical protein